MTLSPQEQSTYRILLNANRPLTAKALASQMRIPPPLIYRLTKTLLSMGLVTKISGYPLQFKAKPANEGLSLFLLHQNEWFSEQFSASSPRSSIARGRLARLNDSNVNEIRLSFIQSRDELMSESTEELIKATKSFDILRSGHEIPAETMLAMFEAKKRGVRVRMLIQNYSSDTAFQVRYWVKNGVSVRKTSLRHIRIMIFDSSIAYFMSYKHDDSARDLGMKISYPPFAIILSNLFEKWWQKAEII